MIITLVRDILGTDFTLGKLWVDGKFFGYTVEDTDRLHCGESKLKAQTAIPSGTYEVRHTFSPKFGRIVPEVLHVPGFQGIRIHAGNDKDDTEGCILPGTHRTATGVSGSRDAVAWLEGQILRHNTTLHIVYEIPLDFEHEPNH